MPIRSIDADRVGPEVYEDFRDHADADLEFDDSRWKIACAGRQNEPVFAGVDGLCGDHTLAQALAIQRQAGPRRAPHRQDAEAASNTVVLFRFPDRSSGALRSIAIGSARPRSLRFRPPLCAAV